MSDVPEVYKLEGIPRAALGPLILASKKNLLHNWDFRNPVNQRGQSSYTATGYTIDRWRMPAASLTVNVVTGGLELVGGASNSWFEQFIETDLTGETVTFSIELDDGTIYSYTATINDTTQTKDTPFGYIGLAYTAPYNRVVLRINAGQTITVVRAKLERGTVSTLAYDPPADYGEQLALCQRYYEVVGGGNAYEKLGIGMYSTASTFSMVVPFKAEKRIAPTVTATGNFSLSGTTITGASVANDGSTKKSGAIIVSGLSGKTPGQSALMYANNDITAKIEFSADI